MTQKIEVCFASTTFTVVLSVITLRIQFVTYISSILKLPSHRAKYCLTGKILLVPFCPRRATAVNHQITNQYPDHPFAAKYLSIFNQRRHETSRDQWNSQHPASARISKLMRYCLTFEKPLIRFLIREFEKNFSIVKSEITLHVITGSATFQEDEKNKVVFDATSSNVTSGVSQNKIKILMQHHQT